MSKKKRAKLKPDAWMPLYLGDYLRDTTHLNTEQHGAYLLLLGAMWRNGARLPNDDQQLAAITGLGIKKWRAAKPVLMLFFSVSDNWLFQKRLSEEYQHAWAVYGKRVESGKKGGRPTDGDLFDDTERDTERLPERGAESPPQPQPQPPSSPTNTASVKIPEASTDARARAAMQVCKAIATSGTECSTLDAHLLKALDDGFTAEELIALTRSKKGQGKGIAYLVKTLRGQRVDAAAAQAPTPIEKPAVSAEQAAREAEIRELENEIYDARHLCDTSEAITPKERDRRIQAARLKLRQLQEDS